MKFVVFGGGTAGWLTALYIQHHFPQDSITVVSSSEIGVLGAGEGTTPPFVNLLEEIGIDENDLFEHCKATIKTGIKFTNWHGDGESYFHNFSEGLHALHFDARSLAKYLQDRAVERGIEAVDTEVTDVLMDNLKNISGLVTSSEVIRGDFFFDCSGFNRSIIGKVYRSPWQNYPMPCSRAIPFFLPNSGIALPEYTESIALKYGWMWKIPVQGRYGCGYVFDLSKTTDEEARQEIRDHLGYDFVSPKTINFQAGTYKTSWINNCLAIGLSAGFIEPLEATSIWLQVISLKLFVELFNKHPQAIEKYNHDIDALNNDILSFLYYHYLTKRNDTDFWKNFRFDNTMPKKLSTLISSRTFYSTLDSFNFRTFENRSWQAISNGIRWPVDNK